MTAVAVVDAIRDILPTLDAMVADDSAAEPSKSLPGRLYVWPRRMIPQKLEEAKGRWDEADLRIRVLWTLNAKGEPRVLKRDRAISESLDGLIDAAHDIVAANRRHPLWWDLYIENVSYDAVRSFDVRGAGLDLVVRLNAPALESGAASGS